MSDLQKSFAKSRLAKLPAEPPVLDELDEATDEIKQSGDHDDDNSSASSTSSTGTVKPSGQNLFARPAPYVALSPSDPCAMTSILCPCCVCNFLPIIRL